MGWFQDCNRWLDERYRLIQLQHEISLIHASYEEDLQRASLPGMPVDGYDMLYAEMDGQTRQLSDEYDRILTDRTLRRAARLGVPVPSTREERYWIRSDYERRLLLTTEGQSFLRREISTEREILQKPWLNWGAFVISIAGLIISIAALTRP